MRHLTYPFGQGACGISGAKPRTCAPATGRATCVRPTPRVRFGQDGAVAILVQEYRAIDGTRLPVYVHLPGRGRLADWDGRSVIVHLHGGMERGRDPARLLATGLAARCRRGLPVRSAVLMPHCPGGRTWLDLRAALGDLLDRSPLIRRARPPRVALTGVSMGGAGAWALASDRPDRFDAVAPICGPVPDLAGFPGRVRRLVSTAVHAFHGALDRAVPVSNSITLVDTLRRAGGNVRLTIYPRARHEAWEDAYDDPAFWSFLVGPPSARHRGG